MKSLFRCSCCNKIETEDRIIHSNSYEHSKVYGNNRVVNSKYTILTFLPFILFAHLKRFMNLYFIIIGCLQLWKDVSPVNPLTMWAPIVLIFAIAFVREGIDDYQQHQLDKAVNTRKYRVIRDSNEITLESQEITVGDIVILMRDQESPCDMTLLYTSNPKRKAFIETANLDGETNLKEVVAPKDIFELRENGLKTRKIIVKCQPPCPDLNSFNGNAYISSMSEPKILISKEQFIQAGVFIKNVDFIYGLACYTGNQTKLGLNSNPPPIKWTQIEKFLDKCSLLIFLLQIILALIYGSIGNWQKHILEKTEPYLLLNLESDKTAPIILYVRCYLLTSVMIPISLKVTLDVCKYIYAVWIRNDVLMYDFGTRSRTMVSNTSVIEDLGAIQYIFSDKTGTMTENEMILKKIGIESQFFGHSNEFEDIYGDTSLQALFKTADLSQDQVALRNRLMMLIFNLCVCNTVKIYKDEKGEAYFEGISSEEVSFLKGLQKIGVNVSSNEEESVTIESNELEIAPITFEIIEHIPFSFERKRMSVIVKNRETGALYLFCKGAHEKILSQCSTTYPDFIKQVDTFSFLGLRVMAMSYKEVEEEDYFNFSSALNEARAEDNLGSRESAINMVFANFEDKQVLLGCTGIEDRLQDGVPQTISMLRDAGIKIWMVTGDVQGTAIKIARATQLITDDGPLIDITNEKAGLNPKEILEAIEVFIENDDRPFYLVIRSDSQMANDYLEIHQKQFAKVAAQAKCVICARTTPKQKSRFVEIIQSLKKVTLAIGDGGNDVVMIRSAHIGVGILGKEGRQAANASDFAISRFNSLQRLLLVHGRFSFYRTSWLTQFCFYKSFMLALVQVAFMFWNGYSGASFFNDFNLMCYNAIFTLLPVIFFLFDKDVEEETVFLHPYIYSDSRLRTFCNPRSMFWWIIRAIYQAAVVVVIINFSITCKSVNGDGSPIGLDEVQQITYSSLVLNVLFTVVFDTQNFTSLNFIFIWGNWLLYILFTIFANLIPDFSMVRDIYLVCWKVYINPYDWIVAITATTLSVMPVVFIQSLFSTLLPTNAQQLRYNEVTNQSQYKPTYLVNFNENGNFYRLKSADEFTVWDKSHNCFTPLGSLLGCI